MGIAVDDGDEDDDGGQRKEMNTESGGEADGATGGDEWLN